MPCKPGHCLEKWSSKLLNVFSLLLCISITKARSASKFSQYRKKYSCLYEGLRGDQSPKKGWRRGESSRGGRKKGKWKNNRRRKRDIAWLGSKMVSDMFPSSEPWSSIPAQDLVMKRDPIDLAFFIFITLVFCMAYKGHRHGWVSGREFGRWDGFGRDEWFCGEGYRIYHQMEPK